MYLKETVMTNQEQIAFFVTLAHNEFLEQLIDDCLEPKSEAFDQWLPFIGECAFRLSGVYPR